MGKIIGIIAIVVVVVVGAYLWSQQSKSLTGENGAESAIDAARDAKNALESGTFSSLKDVMSLGAKMTCTYSSTDSGKAVSSTVVVEGKKFQSTTTMEGETIYALNDGTTQYTWTSGSKEGYKMELSCLEEFMESMKNLPQGEQSKTPDVEESFDAADNVSCSPGGDVSLEVPKDITFTDQCAMMKQTTEMMKNLPAGMPTSY